MATKWFTLGVGQEKERLQTPASLSLASLSLWLQTENPRHGQGNSVSKQGEFEAAPRKILPHNRQLRNPKKVETSEDDNEAVVTVGSQYTFTEKKRTARSIGYATETRDESERRDNPGNEQASPANGGGVRVKGIRASVINLFLRLQTLPHVKQQWLSLVNAKRQPPLWKKISWCSR